MQQPPITVEAAGLLSRAKRRQDYCRTWYDFDLDRWVTSNGDWSPGIQIDRYGYLKFATANGSVMPASSYQGLTYHIHDGLSDVQTIYGVAFEWSSFGPMVWGVYETDDVDGDVWTLLDSGGGATNSTPDTVGLTCSSGQYGLRIRVGYSSGKTLNTGDEWLKIASLRVYGQSGEPTIGDALTDILVTTGLASSYYSASVG